jgi:hypothetical protein
MVNYVPLSKQKHVDQHIVGVKDLKSFVKRLTLPVYGAEVSQLALQFPLGFVRQGEGFVLHLLCSISAELGNVWITEEGKWLGAYLPAIFRQQPFIILPNEQGEKVVCIDEESTLLGDNGSSLFEDGKPSEFLNAMIEFLEKLHVNGLSTQKAIDLMASFDLIVPWEIKVKQSEEKEIPVEDFFKIDEVKLNQLDDSEWIALKKVGAMPFIYGQLLSMRNLGTLMKILKLKVDKRSSKPVTTDNLQTFFGEDENDALNFDGI